MQRSYTHSTLLVRNIRTKANQLRHGLRMVNGKHKSGASVVVSFIHHGAAGHGRSNSFNVAPRSSCVKWLPVNHDKAKTCHCARGLGNRIQLFSHRPRGCNHQINVKMKV